jgi:hypothetical protein
MTRTTLPTVRRDRISSKGRLNARKQKELQTLETVGVRFIALGLFFSQLIGTTWENESKQLSCLLLNNSVHMTVPFQLESNQELPPVSDTHICLTAIHWQDLESWRDTAWRSLGSADVTQSKTTV